MVYRHSVQSSKEVVVYGNFSNAVGWQTIGMSDAGLIIVEREADEMERTNDDYNSYNQAACMEATHLIS